MLRINEGDYHELRRHGEQTYPNESCGVLVGRTDGSERIVLRVAPCGNARADSPHRRYCIEPGEVLSIARQGRAHGESIVGFYHSHPDHPALWSQTDLAEAHWIGCSYVITSVAGGKAQLTRSFHLVGEGARAKRFEDEGIRVTGKAER
jgi:proteasome lid subunit RPN8/RPN11